VCKPIYTDAYIHTHIWSAIVIRNSIHITSSSAYSVYMDFKHSVPVSSLLKILYNSSESRKIQIK